MFGLSVKVNTECLTTAIKHVITVTSKRFFFKLKHFSFSSLVQVAADGWMEVWIGKINKIKSHEAVKSSLVSFQFQLYKNSMKRLFCTCPGMF